MQLGVIDLLWLIDTGCIGLAPIDATGCDRLTLVVTIIAFVDDDHLVCCDRRRWCAQSSSLLLLQFVAIGADDCSCW
jgi:hypothetical protein